MAAGSDFAVCLVDTKLNKASTSKFQIETEPTKKSVKIVQNTSITEQKEFVIKEITSPFLSDRTGGQA